MKNTIITAGFLTANLAFPALALAEVRTLAEWNTGKGWTVSQHADDSNKSFTHCTARKGFAAKNARQRRRLLSNELYFFVKYNRLGRTGLGLMGSDWKTTENRKYRVELTFDDRSKYSVNMIGTPPSGMEVWTNNDNDVKFFADLAKLNWVSVSINGKSIAKVGLRGSRRAITAVLACAAGSMQGEGESRASSDDTFAGDPFDSGTFSATPNAAEWSTGSIR